MCLGLVGRSFESEDAMRARMAEIDAYWEKMGVGRRHILPMEPFDSVTPEEQEAAYREFLESEMDSPPDCAWSGMWVAIG